MSARKLPDAPISRHCLHCGHEHDAETMGLIIEHGPLTCPDCGRDGCYECMPSGRDCSCPECEKGGSNG